MCHVRKSARQTVTDPETKTEVSIFNPRQQLWKEHFLWDDVRVVGLTATGRGTVEALKINRAMILAIRGEEGLLGRHPPF